MARASSPRSPVCSTARRASAAGPTAPPHALTLTGVRYAGDAAGGDRVRCLVTRGHGDGRELLVLEAEDGEPRLPGGAFEPEERVDSAAYRAVRAATGVGLTTIPRPLGLECLELGTTAEERTRIVWLDAPEGLEPDWGHGGRPLPLRPARGARGPRRDRAPVALIAAAV